MRKKLLIDYRKDMSTANNDINHYDVFNIMAIPHLSNPLSKKIYLCIRMKKKKNNT